MFHKKVVEKISRRILYSITFFFENRAVCEIMWKNTVEPGRPKMTVRRMRITCWIPMSADTGIQHVIAYCFSPATMIV